MHMQCCITIFEMRCLHLCLMKIHNATAQLPPQTSVKYFAVLVFTNICLFYTKKNSKMLTQNLNRQMKTIMCSYHGDVWFPHREKYILTHTYTHLKEPVCEEETCFLPGNCCLHIPPIKSSADLQKRLKNGGRWVEKIRPQGDLSVHKSAPSSFRCLPQSSSVCLEWLFSPSSRGVWALGHTHTAFCLSV